jgi:hypothetical protein
MRGAIPPLPNTPSWRGDQFQKAQAQYIYLNLCLKDLVKRSSLNKINKYSSEYVLRTFKFLHRCLKI